MRKKRMLIGMCSWKNPNLLKKCIESLLRSIDTSQDGIAVVLNEADEESISYLKVLGISFVCHADNRGAIAIDYLKPFIEDSEYFLNINDDMYFHRDFTDDLIDIIETYYPATASCRLIENFHSGNGCVVVDPEIKSIYDLDFDKFNERCKNYRNLNLPRIISYTHPICTKSKDFIAIGGYTNKWHPGYDSGYGRDDAYPMELLKYNPKYRFITSNKSFVFHQSSETNKRLPPHIRNQSNHDSFAKDYGITIHQFRASMNIFSPVD